MSATDQTHPTSQVVSMCARSAEKFRAPLRLIESHWRSLIDNGAVPRRCNVDPRAIESALENAFIMERVGAGGGKLRVAGAHLNDLAGMAVAGQPLASFFTQSARFQLQALLTRVFEEGATLRLTLRSQGSVWGSGLTAEMVILPLQSDFEETSRALGGLISQGQIGQTPRRFEIEEAHVQGFGSSTSEQVIDNTPGTRSAVARPIALPTEVSAPTADGATTPHIRLVVSND